MPKDPLWKLSMAAVLVEKHGFDGLWVSEHFFNRNSFITLSTIARHTRRILLGPAVVNPYVYHPAQMAQAAATLWELAPHRVRMAIGAGDASVLKQLGYTREKPVEKVMWAVEEMRNYLKRLETYRVSDIMVYVGAQGPRMVKASTKADGVLINWSNLEMLNESIRLLGDDVAKGFTRAAYLMTSIHDDEEKAWKTAVPYAAYLMIGSSLSYLNRIGVDEAHRKEVEELVISRNWDRLYQVARREWVDFFSVWGKPGRLREFVDEVVDMGFDEVVFAGPLGPRFMKALKSIASICRAVKRRL
ncbi:F420-dependent N5,N10-methenyltetrahydromethanopterin reductase [Candidatus Caldarchaeum subterraneum]|uniref:F420-dependent N5,N10-methenyltetrahydromethanopterin reductase n=1 Tax=Caldiarchaeum subterraneum TaxID=311458 RepID=E6N7M8_CALS0|nr:methylenetetrahydromethanopterin reductase [Candidatus Caldarchaeum subterraneum]BAJ48297.1 F420-dependent N5,N10-methenyltetrahydromethanopterin reductase [Candidatus Caldarchaeum subterraneum]BAJ49596.1 F420-dependent N5,N10-methenyltetrahydromethanopterin reductase [Candidatus Caldarchaeum subterraneum]BAJ51071.1 F420-dependent N5,N10-methenyltetrahydromethanopterin reductase [Candidatus Caldarchaeum subterraneum]